MTHVDANQTGATPLNLGVAKDPNQAMKLVLTGGPSGGKTTVAQAIIREFADKVMVVPEAASILWQGGWPRRKTLDGVMHQQRAIFFVQREVESLLVNEHPDKLIICDRGSLDGFAYWPDRDNPESFLTQTKTSFTEEYDRYDWVIHLDTAPEGGYDSNNPLRNETYSEALDLNNRILKAWSGHPRRFIIGTQKSGHFIDKLNCALKIVGLILDGHTFEEIHQAIVSY